MTETSIEKRKKDIDWYVKTTGMRAAALLGTNVVFLAEFSFDTHKTLHLIALCVFAFSTPLLCPIVLARQWWQANPDAINKNITAAFSAITTGATVLTLSGIGLCIWSYSTIAGSAYIAGFLIAIVMLIKYLSFHFCKAQYVERKNIV